MTFSVCLVGYREKTEQNTMAEDNYKHSNAAHWNKTYTLVPSHMYMTFFIERNTFYLFFL